MIKNRSQVVYDISNAEAIVNFVLIFTSVSCTFGAIISAFRFSVDPLNLCLIWIIVSLAASFLIKSIGFKGSLILLAPFILLLIFRFNDITEAVKWIVFYISNEYSTWLFVPVLFEYADVTVSQLTIFYIFGGSILVFPVSYAICIRRSLFLIISFTAPLILITFVHQYSTSNPLFLIGLLAVYITVLFKNSIVVPDFIKKSYSFFIYIVLAVTLLGIAYLIAPQQSYTRGRLVTSLDHHLRGLATQAGIIKIKTGIGWPYVSDGVWSFDTNNIDIAKAGSRVITDERLLEVIASEPGIFYLKGYSMQRFDGSSWSVNTKDIQLTGENAAGLIPFMIAESFSRTNQDPSITEANIVIRNLGDSTDNTFYMPYYSSLDTRQESTFPITFFHADISIPDMYGQLAPESRPGFDLSEYSVSVHDRGTYLQINESTANGLRQIAAEADFDLTADRASIVTQVALHVSTLGHYTLTPLLIPEDEDFTLYFLQNSQHGYCIHYATAATLMLRALDIPARFAVGFVASVSENDIDRPVEITDGDAHAWVEVFYDDYGWLPLEVTPFSTGETGFFPGRPQAGALPLPASAAMEDTLGDGPFIYDGAEENYAESPQAGRLDFRHINGYLLIGILMTGCLITLIIRRIIILMIRKKRFEQADTNAAVIYAWGFLLRFTGPGKQYLISSTIKDIAYKAGFSRHRLTEKERSRVTGYASIFINDAYRQQTRPGRFIKKYIIGL